MFQRTTLVINERLHRILLSTLLALIQGPVEWLGLLK